MVPTFTGIVRWHGVRDQCRKQGNNRFCHLSTFTRFLLKISITSNEFMVGLGCMDIVAELCITRFDVLASVLSIFELQRMGDPRFILLVSTDIWHMTRTNVGLPSQAQANQLAED